MQVIQGERGGLIKAWIDGVQLEDSARVQLNNMAAMPFVHKHVAVMPDVHWGMGATIGSVIPTQGAIIPAAVGVDIGCGMQATRTSLTADDLPDSLLALRTEIEKRVPHGRTDNGGANDRGAWGSPTDEASTALLEVKSHRGSSMMDQLYDIEARHPKIAQAVLRAPNHLGTLGTGNHFVEICLDEEQCVWVMLHSGSRGVGNRIGSYFIELAKQDMRKWFINLPDQDLAYLPEGTEHFTEYLQAVNWAQKFALLNRNLMMQATLRALKTVIHKKFRTDELAVNCHHNYVSNEHHFGADVWVTRKGAVKISETELGIIPGSMGARSFIVRAKPGRALSEAMNSCSHGAGRAMSRNEAKKRFSLEDHAKAVGGVECRMDADVIDETPGAYKDIDAVMAAQADHVEVVHTLKQVLCVKG